MSNDDERNAAARARWSAEPVVDRFASSSTFTSPPVTPPTPSPQQIPSVDFSKTKTVGETRWLRLESITYTTPTSPTPKAWDRVVRTTKKTESSPDAVAILSILRSPTAPSKIVFVKQYRPPMNAMTLELPAGLIDANETPVTAAIREFKEETGYTGTLVSMSPACALSPGMSNETCHIVTLDVDLAAPVNQNVKAKLEEAEAANVMQTVLIEKEGLISRLQEEAANGTVVFAAVWTLAMGISLGSK